MCSATKAPSSLAPQPEDGASFFSTKQPFRHGSNEQIFGANQQVPHVGGSDQEAEKFTGNEPTARPVSGSVLPATS